MNTVKKNSHKVIAHTSGEVPGFLLKDGGVSFTTHNLPSSDHFFTASDFRLDADSENLYILFGQVSRFSSGDESEFRLAIEIVFSREHARDCFYTTVFETPSINTNEPFISHLDRATNVHLKNGNYSYGLGKLGIPKDNPSYRKFTSNFATSTTSSGQGLIEFFEASPDLLLVITTGRQIRPNMGAKQVVSVLMPVTMMFSLFKEMEKIFLKEERDETKI